MVAGMHNDNWLARQNSIRLYGPLLKAGIQILEYNRTMLHQKTMVVDGVWATVGTTNFDSRSFAHNEENNVCFCDASCRDSWKKSSWPTSRAANCHAEAWRNRGLLAKSLAVRRFAAAGTGLTLRRAQG